jgi:phenylacetate-CoA ligase
MQASLQTAFFELLDFDAQGVADLVVTTLTNPFMPLIRYRIGDLVERLETPYATRYILHGRTADAFQLPSHARVTTRMVDQCFKGLAGIAHYQVIQRGDGTWVVRFVPERAGLEPAHSGEVQERLSQLLQSNTPVEFQKTDMLVPEKSGKFRIGYPSRKT